MSEGEVVQKEEASAVEPSAVPGLPDIVCIQLKTGMWSGMTPLEAGDLGLEEQEVPKKIFKLGGIRLYPDTRKTEFTTLTGRGSQYLNRVGLPFVINTVYMVPKFRLPKIVEELKKIKTEFHALADKFQADYPELQEAWLKECDDLKPGISATLEKLYPKAEQIRKKFKFNWAVFTVRGITAQAVDDLALMDTIQESKKQFEAQCEEMVRECIEVLRQKVSKTVKNLSDRIRSGKIVKNTTLESVKNIHEQFKELNIFGDTDVEESLAKLRNMLDGVADAAFLKDNTVLQNQILALADDVSKQSEGLSDLGDMAGRYKRLIELD